MKKIVLIGIAGLMALSSCKKVSACLESDITTAKLGQEVTFTNCSENEEEASLDAGNGDGDETITESMKVTYHTVGTHTATLTATKKDKSETEEISISIDEPTTSEIIGTWNLQSTQHYVYGFTVTLPSADELIINSDNTSSNGDWTLSDNASLTIGSRDYKIYTLYNDEMVLQEIESENDYYLYTYTK